MEIIIIIVVIVVLFIVFDLTKIQKDTVDPTIVRRKNPDVVKCPKCNSTQVQLVPRRWSLFNGLMTNKVDRVCLNCKNKF